MAKVLRPEVLIGKKFKVIKSDHPKLKKIKRPLDLVKKFNLIMDKSKNFSFSFVTSVAVGDDLYVVRQDTPTKGVLHTTLKLIERNNMDLKKINESLKTLRNNLYEQEKSVKQMAQDISDNMNINSKIHEFVEEYFDSKLVLSREDKDKMYKEIKKNLKKELSR